MNTAKASKKWREITNTRHGGKEVREGASTRSEDENDGTRAKEKKKRSKARSDGAKEGHKQKTKEGEE